jgi:hypothetical protein
MAMAIVVSIAHCYASRTMPMKITVVLVVALLALSVSVAGGQSRAEVSAVGSLRLIISAEMTYASTCGHGGYAISLEDLARPPRGEQGAVISPDFSTNGVTIRGYKFTVRKDARRGASDVTTAATTCNGSAGNPASSFFATAEPVDPSTLDRFFAADDRGIIFFSNKPIPNPIRESATFVRYK